jgi:D-cysteine desulfhydrase family pyridoxal phosphate-dependent enzyme
VRDVSTSEPTALLERLESFARCPIAHGPTPLEPLPRLSAALGGPPIWIKRDDCTGLATGGNKARKLEFLMGAARQQDAAAVISFGALQSNHARQTAAACAALGIECHLVLVDLVAYREPAYERSGNLLLDDLLGAEVHRVQYETAAAGVLAELLARLEQQGKGAYVVPTGGSSAVGALGYVRCAAELTAQIAEAGIDPSALVHATSSAGTQAGLLVGLRAAGQPLNVIGINTYAQDSAHQQEALRTLCDETAALLGEPPLPEDDLRIEHGFLGPGYGQPTEAMLEAVRLVAREEGILLDPVYSGKAMSGLIGLIRAGRLPDDRPVIFLHTGGSAGLFAYVDTLRD